MPVPSLPLAVVEVEEDKKAVGSMANSTGSAAPPLAPGLTPEKP